MKQKVKTPEIIVCRCGHTPKVRESYDSYDPMRAYGVSYEVHCANCTNTGPQYCGSIHRAICKWNNRMLRQ